MKSIDGDFIWGGRGGKKRGSCSLESISLMEKNSWRQKSRALWFKEWDKCTKFIHQLANSHQRNNAIEVLHEGDITYSNQEVINEHIVSFYKQLFREDYSWRPKVDGWFFIPLVRLVPICSRKFLKKMKFLMWLEVRLATRLWD